jgi:hypothetical protein
MLLFPLTGAVMKSNFWYLWQIPIAMVPSEHAQQQKESVLFRYILDEVLLHANSVNLLYNHVSSALQKHQ